MMNPFESPRQKLCLTSTYGGCLRIPLLQVAKEVAGNLGGSKAVVVVGKFGQFSGVAEACSIRPPDDSQRVCVPAYLLWQW